MPRHHRVEELLDRADLDALKEFSREPGRKVDEVHEWMQAKGLTLARSSAGRWLQSFLQEDRFSASHELAAEFASLMAGKDTATIAKSGDLKVSQMVFEQLVRRQADDELDTRDLYRLARTLHSTVTTEGLADEVRAEVEKRERAKQEAAVKEVEKAAKDGADGPAVARKMRELLGLVG